MTLGSHQRCVGKSQSHFTPKWIIDALGPFDLDPCAGDPRPWDCAYINWTRDGLSKGWGNPRRPTSRVWLNPPFNRYEVYTWINRLANHGHGIALLHARTETDWFEPIWKCADAIHFLADRIKFCDERGNPQKANSGAPAVLIAFGAFNVRKIRASGIPGYCVTSWGQIKPKPLLSLLDCDLARGRG